MFKYSDAILNKMTKRLDRHSEVKGYDSDEICFGGDTETDTEYIWNCEHGEGREFVKFKTVYDKATKKISFRY